MSFDECKVLAPGLEKAKSKKVVGPDLAPALDCHRSELKPSLMVCTAFSSLASNP